MTWEPDWQKAAAWGSRGHSPGSVLWLAHALLLFPLPFIFFVDEWRESQADKLVLKDLSTLLKHTKKLLHIQLTRAFPCLVAVLHLLQTICTVVVNDLLHFYPMHLLARNLQHWSWYPLCYHQQGRLDGERVRGQSG